MSEHAQKLSLSLYTHTHTHTRTRTHTHAHTHTHTHTHTLTHACTQKWWWGKTNNHNSMWIKMAKVKHYII